MSQRQATFGDLKLNHHELLAALAGSAATIFRQYDNKLTELTNQNQQLMADLAKLKVQQTKEPKEKKK